MLNAAGTVPFSGLIAAYKPPMPAASQMLVNELNSSAPPASQTSTAQMNASKTTDKVVLTNAKAMPLMTADSTQCRREMGYLPMTENSRYIRDLSLSKVQKGTGRTVSEGQRMANFNQGGSAFAEVAASALDRQTEDTQFEVNLVPLSPPTLRLVSARFFDMIV